MAYNFVPMNIRVYLNVPFSEKEEAKELGCRWDSERKSGIVLIVIMERVM